MANILDKIKNKFFPSATMPSGNVLQSTAATTAQTVVVSQDLVDKVEPYGTQVPEYIKARASGWSQIQNLSEAVDITKVQAALRAAERGDTTMLFTYYRDMFMTSGIVATELSKRKLAVLSEPYNILPIDKNNADDVNAAKVIKEIIDNCPSWNESLAHMMNSIIYPVAVAEKIFEPAPKNDLNIRYYLKELFPVDYTLLCYRLPYLPQGPINPTNQIANQVTPLPTNIVGSNPINTIYDLDFWEPDLRFWHVFDNGLVDRSWSNIYAPDQNRHMVYRCNLLQGIARDNFGGLGRSLMFWTLMANLGREFFLRMLDRYGVPFVVAKVDTAQADTVAMLETAFNMSNRLGALMVNKDAQIEIQSINLSGASEGHKLFLDFCHDQISLLISGQTLSSNARSTGMGSGVANLQSSVRDDIKSYDRITLGNLLRSQLFKQILDINGIAGKPPRIIWGGETPTNSKDVAVTLYNLAQAGIRPTEEAIAVLSEKFGFQLELGEAVKANGKNEVAGEVQTEKSDATK